MENAGNRVGFGEGRRMVLSMDSLVHHPQVWERASRFLWDPLQWVHPLHLQPLFPEEHVEVDRLTPWARRFTLERLGITPCVHTFPVADGSRVLLLDTEDLTRLAQWLGALAYTRPLRTLLQGESVRALQTALPGVYPECLHELGWFLPDLPRLQAVVSAEEMPTVEQLTCVGHRLLFAHLSHLPEPLLRRFQLRFSPEQLSAWKPLLPWRCSDADRVLLQRLLKRVSPGGYDLCCC